MAEASQHPARRVLERLQSAPQHAVPAAIPRVTSTDYQSDRQLARALDGYLSGFIPSRGSRELRRPLSGDLKAKITNRLAMLDVVLEPSRDRDAIEIAVGAMLAGFLSARATGDDAMGIITQYVAVLADLPLWAIQRVCDAYAHGRISGQNRDFAPSAATLHHKALDLYLESLRDERQNLMAVLDAPIEQPCALASR